MIKTVTSNSLFKTILLGGILSLFTNQTNAQVSLTTIGTPYIQNFDGLANTGTGLSIAIPGWTIFETGANANQFYVTGTGSSATGDTYSYGSAASSERALGSIASTNLLSSYGASFVNNTGGYITDLGIEYQGEQWRSGDVLNVKDSLVFEYSLDATSLSTGTWTPVTALNFKSPITTAAAGLLDGNLIANQAIVSGSINALAIPAGATFWVRLKDINISGADDGLSVDNFVLVPSFMPRLNIMDVTAMEGSTGTTAFNFYAYLSVPAGAGGVTFDITTLDNTAIAPADYATQTVTATIPQGANTYTFTVLVNGDGTQELNEDFNVTISNVTNALLEDGVGLGTIVNDDIIPPSITAQPENFTACNGSNAMFMSQAFGDPTPTVQWQVSTNGGALWTDIPSQTTDMLMFTASISENGNMYRSIYTNSEGADTSYEATLFVNPTYNLNVTDSVCNNGSYQFPDGTIINNITSMVSHTSNLTTTIFGCDSIINTTVNVNPVYNLNETATVCEGNNFTFPDGTIATSINTQLFHTSNLTSIYGCDSIINTTVNVNMIDSVYTTATICAGDSIYFHGTYLITPNTYYFDTTNVVGCDSVIILDLFINQIPSASFTTTTNGSTVDFLSTSTGGTVSFWTFGDNDSSTLLSPTHVYSADGIYTACLSISSIYGCVDTACAQINIQTISLKQLNNVNEVSVFPNPAHDKLSVEFAAEINVAKVSMVNMIGEQVLTQSLNSKANVIELNLSSIEAGVYYLLIENGTERIVRKVIVE